MLSRSVNTTVRTSLRRISSTTKQHTPPTARSYSHFIQRYTRPSQQQHLQTYRRTYASTPMAAPTDTQAEATANTTGITPDTLSSTLKEKVGATHVVIEDISGGCGASFTALIVSPHFEGKNLLARSRLVNNALKQEIAAIHAWTPRCLTPAQWEGEKEKMGQ